jgi:hypothetical protein
MSLTVTKSEPVNRATAVTSRNQATVASVNPTRTVPTRPLTCLGGPRRSLSGWLV